ncbi:unnamed protein product (macronuclear) [Paramecium tetraurelia]|uniref:Uncharacterized protein n=1 Tax=Paramecium tetraurelia TaxID=5888 RepID=A0BBK3_PARTE|nr:uncharacterized protein GSPATT00000355001 [Paramecium tetraurelia]CAK55920.1 unnamed protein product [Paramecium tetraurelia]|eukprot:XP_001423318.1 hypothetical protein (macronuclear) [Paramecium tetraurelia strain d4-2]
MTIIHRFISYCYLWLPKQIQKSVQKTLFQQQENGQVYKIEFSNGEVQKIINFENTINYIQFVGVKNCLLSLVIPSYQKND